jgi:ring-1,2-phenylacetyl-CoA epoxidase subunit PaaE
MFKLFSKKNPGTKEASDRYQQLKINEVRKETDDTNTLVFETEGTEMTYLPGQFLTLIIPIDGKEVRRSYSLSSSPYTQEDPAITIKRVDAGVVSNYVNDHMSVGDVFKVMAPAGHFTPELDSQNTKQYVLFAAGSGITPIMSILKSILIKEPNSHVTLIYQSRNENSIIFKDVLSDLAQQYENRLRLMHILSQPSGAWSGMKGRITAQAVKEMLDEAEVNDIRTTENFLCGPTGFMEIVNETLTTLNVPDKQIHKESFYSGDAKDTKKQQTKKSGESTVVNIVLDGETFEVPVPEGRTILEAALDQDIDMPFSCQSGLCTACRGKLLSGEVEMDNDDGLSEDEIKDGYVLNCVGHPQGTGVKIEIG